MGSLIAIIGGVVGVFTILSKVLESLVSHILSERRNKASSVANLAARRETTSKAGYTADLAVQRRALDDVQDDLGQIEQLVREVKTGLTKDVPYSMAKIDTKITTTQQDIQELQRGIRELQSVLSGLRTSLDGNTTATKSLYELLAKLLRSDR